MLRVQDISYLVTCLLVFIFSDYVKTVYGNFFQTLNYKTNQSDVKELVSENVCM